MKLKRRGKVIMPTTVAEKKEMQPCQEELRQPWEELIKWGTAFTKRVGLTVEDTDEILKKVRENNSGNRS